MRLPTGLELTATIPLLLLPWTTSDDGKPLIFKPFPTSFLRLPSDISFTAGRYFVVDEKANSVVVLDGEGQWTGRLGSIGSGPGEFFRPVAVVLGQPETLFVHDLGNQRLQELSLDGQPLVSMPLPEFESFAIGSGDRVFLNRPGGERLVEIFDKSGEFQRGFGRRYSCTEIYGSDCSSHDYPWEEVLNRCVLATDSDHNLYAVFRFAPLVVKFDPNGAALWETRLKGPLVQRLSKRFVEDASGAEGFVRTAVAGRGANVVCLDAAFDSPSATLYLLLPGFAIVEVGSDGNQKRTFQVQAEGLKPGIRFAPFRLPLAQDGRALVIDIFQPQIYLATLPPEVLE